MAAFLSYEVPATPVSTQGAEAAADDGQPPDWLSQAMGAIPGPETARAATTREQALAAYERHFFGEIKDVHEL